MACTQAPCSPLHPRISFSQDFAESDGVPSMDPSVDRGARFDSNTKNDDDDGDEKDKDFEFIVMDTRGTASTSKYKMMSADELFFQGRMLCLDQIHRISIEEERQREDIKPLDLMDPRYVDDDPSPRPPRCTVGRWRELLRLKRQQPSRGSSPCKSTFVPDVTANNAKDSSNSASRKEDPTPMQPFLSGKRLQVKALKESRSNTGLQRSSSNPERLSSSHPEKLSTLLLRKREKQEEQCLRSCCRGSTSGSGNSVDRSRSLSIRVSPVLNVVPMCSPNPSHLFPTKKQMQKPARFHSNGGGHHVSLDGDQKKR